MQPCHVEPGGVGIREFGDDLVEGQRPGVDHPSVRRTQRQQLVGHDRAGVQAYRATAQQPLTAHGDQVGGAGARPDEVDGHRLVTDHWVTGSAGRQPVKPPMRFTTVVLKPPQLAADLRIPPGYNGFGFRGDRVGDQPPAGREPLEAGFEQPRLGETAADEDHRRLWRVDEGLRRFTAHLDTDPEGHDVGRDPRAPLLVAFERHRSTAGAAAAPFDGDAARSGAHVPQQLTGSRCQRSERHRPHRLFGDLPVVGERVVGQNLRLPIIGQVAHGDDIEIVDVVGRVGRPVAGDRVAAALGRAAELLEHTDLGVTSAGVGEQAREGGGTVGVAGQHYGLTAATHRGVRLRGDQADHLGVLHGPAQPGARQGHRRHMRQHGDPIPAEQPDQRAADAV